MIIGWMGNFISDNPKTLIDPKCDIVDTFTGAFGHGPTSGTTFPLHEGVE